MKKNLTVWKRTISSVAALAIVLSLGAPLTAYGVEYPASSTTSPAAQSETGTDTQTASWDETAVKAIGTATGKDAVEKIYNYLRNLEGHKDAQSFQTLAAKPAYGVTSKTIKGKLSNAEHSWNAVQLDGAWYAVDVEKGVLLAGSKTLLADGKTAFGSAYVSSETENKTVLSEDNYKISITITPAASTKVYGDNDPAFTYNASDKTVVLEGNISRTGENDVGEYAYTLGDLKVKDTAKAGQYKLVLAANAPKFKVTARPLTIKDIVLQENSKTANGDADVPFQQIVLDNVVGQDDVSVDLTKIKAVVSSADAGVYKDITVSGITLRGAKEGNYTIPETSPVTKTFEIKSPEPPAVVADEGETGKNDTEQKSDENIDSSNNNTSSNVNSNEADKDTSSDNNSNNENNSTSTSNETSGESQNPDSSQTGTDNPSSGEGSIPTTPSTPDSTNPPSNNEQNVPEGKTVIITVDSLEKIYGEDDPKPTYSSSMEIELKGELSREPGTDAGTYKYTLGTLAPVNQDYKLELADNNAALTIKPQQVTVAVPNQYKYVNEADKKIEYVLSKEMPVTGAIQRTPGEAVGKYSYSIGTLAPANETDKKNYTFVLASNVGTFEILPAGSAVPSQKVQVFVTPDSKEKVFGEPDPEPTYKLSQAITVTGKLNRKPGEDAGTYAYTLDGLTPSSDLFELVLADTQSPAALTIQPKTIEVTFQPQSKTYGEKDPTPAYTLGETIEVRGTPSRESGEDVANGHLYPYTLGTLAAASRNYKLVAADNGAALTITPRTVDILFRRPASNDVEFNYASGMAYVEHDGKAKQVDAFYQTARGEESKVSILYNGSSEAPKDQGIYNISVSIEDPNYLISDKELSITQMMIRQKTFSAVDVSRTVSKDDTSRKFVPLTQFGVPANAFQYVYVYNMEGDYIFGNTPEIKNGNLYYQLRPELLAGMESSIILRLLENNSYGFNEFRLKVAVGEQGFEITVQNPPPSVTLGNDIRLSTNFQLVTKYDDGSKPVTETITQDMLSGYNKSATGNDSIGKKTITVTSKKHSGTASFVITVEDRITGLEVGAPDQLEYSTGDSRLDLSGGWVAMKMQSGLPQLRYSLTMSMLNVTNSILDKAGSYPVRVTYNNYSLARAFTIEVERSSMNWSDGDWYPVDSRPDSGDFGLSLDTDNLKGSHDKEDIHLVVGEVTGSEYYDLDDYMEDRSVDDYEIMDLSLYDSYKDENVEIRSGYITILIPYPSNTSSSKHNFTVYHLVNGRVRTEAVTTQSSHLKISVNSLSPFAVAWKRKSSGISNSGGSSGGSGNLSDAIQHQREMDEFWDDVSDTLGDTNPGRAVLVDAGDYDYFPSRVLNSIRNRDVTLKIQNDNTKTIVLNGKEIPSKSSLETSYTMSELYKLAQGLSSSSSSSGSRPSGNTSGSLEDLWEDVVKSLKSYQDGTTITINAKDNSAVPKTVLDAIRGRNITMKLKSDDYPQMTINGLELPVGLESKKQYSLNELYNASVPASVSDLESLWSDVVESLKSYKSGARVTINAGNNTFIPETLLDAIRGRNVTVDMKSDYTSQMITLNGSSMPRSLSGERYYTISQLVNRAKSGGNIIQVPNTGNPEPGNSNTNNVTNNNTSNIGGNTAGTSSRPASSAVLPQGGIQQGSSSQAQSSAVSSPSGTVGVSSSSSQSSSKVVEPPSVTINPPLNGQDGETIPSIEATEQTSSILPKVIIGIMVLAILVVVGLLVFLLGGKRSH